MITNCGVEDCLEPIQAKGWCKKHYERWRKTGDPLTSKGTNHLEGSTPYDRLMSIVVVRESGCAEATERLDENGYPRIKVTKNGKSRMVRGHRIVWEHHHGPIPRGRNVLHSCDNPSCVEISHLRLGSLADNGKDVAVRERRLKLGSAKLSAEDVRTIRERVAAGETQRQVAQDFEVSPSHVSKIVHGKSRRHA